MSATALAQENIWLDKSSYHNVERLYHEKAAKLGTYCKMVSQKNVDKCLLDSNTCASAKLSNLMNTKNPSVSKSEKSKYNKILDNLSNENAQNVKNKRMNSKPNTKRGEPNLERKEVVENNSKEIELISSNSNNKKCKPKEAKEKKNKADEKHKNNEEDKHNFEDSKDRLFSQGRQQSSCSVPSTTGGSLANEVAKARQHIKQSLQCMDGIAAIAGVSPSQDVSSRLTFLEKENKELRSIVGDLKNIVGQLNKRVQELGTEKPYVAVCPVKPESISAKKDENEDDDVDLFGSDSEGEDAEAAKIREERLAAYNAKKSKKPVLIAKSNIILDVKPWDDETDMQKLEAEVRKIETDGLFWGAAKLVPLAYGIHKLQISCVVEDDKVSVDWLTEKIQEQEEYVQSVDIAAFNKV